jgi:lycopene cyclase domain-containing protein
MLAASSVLLAGVLDLAVLRTGLLRSGIFWRAYAILLFFQLLVNGALTGLSIVSYDPNTILGPRIAFAPVEDLAFGFALILCTLTVWVRLTRRTADRSSSR